MSIQIISVRMYFFAKNNTFCSPIHKKKFLVYNTNISVKNGFLSNFATDKLPTNIDSIIQKWYKRGIKSHKNKVRIKDEMSWGKYDYRWNKQVKRKIRKTNRR